ncbi:MAG: hypothetical protein CMA98_03080 [Euryarchaeota archaeon]|jgi:biotin-(acetyl-CoA carboxylase) ligase/methylase of polypeptide subunit release factors|nr:hypothetical protein [Euryarchaeota archaeon]|tara:strand:- start:151 stop:1524 length:1374 start_codon:yes stop_codon:yes gene_type:complete
MNLGEEENPILEVQVMDFKMENGEIISLDIPKTVYPPREDSALLIDVLTNLKADGVAMEIGCGSGIISIIMAKNNWIVEACDINPYAIAAAKENSVKASVDEKINFKEGGLGDENFSIPRNTKLIFWNLPYLNPPSPDHPRLGWIEEASMSDLEGKGWGHHLVDFLEENKDNLEPDLLVILLQRKYPESPSSTDYWIKLGWSHRVIKSLWIHEEKIEVVAYWKPGQGVPATTLDECDSTMDEAKKLSKNGWQRIRTEKQIGGRGRRNSIWSSDNKDLLATWNINKTILDTIEPGIMQIIVGTRIAKLLQQYNKWPNDIYDKNGNKIGGVLIEMDNQDDFLRIGVGINYSNKKIEGKETFGWSEKMPETSKIILFNMIDATLSTLFEEHKLLENNLTSNSIKIESWRGISKLLSRGYSLQIKDEKTRVVGMNENGELITLSGKRKINADNLDKIYWLF